MKVLDTNLWVFGTLGTHAQAVDWLDAIEAGETTSAINAYMVQEALDAFDRTPGRSAAERDGFKTEFLTRLVRMTGLLEAPSSRDLSDCRHPPDLLSPVSVKGFLIPASGDETQSSPEVIGNVS